MNVDQPQAGEVQAALEQSLGHLLCQAFADTFEGGGWADAPVWEDFDEGQQHRWQRAAERFTALLPQPPGSGGHAGLVERFEVVGHALAAAEVAAVYAGDEGKAKEYADALRTLSVIRDEALRSIPNPEPDKALVADLLWIAGFAEMRSKDESKVLARVSRGALRTIAERAQAALHRLQPQQGGDAPQAEGGAS